MKPLSAVLENIVPHGSAPEPKSDSSRTRQHGLTVSGGTMNLPATTTAALRDIAEAARTVPAAETAKSLSALCERHFGQRLTLSEKLSKDFDLIGMQATISTHGCEGDQAIAEALDWFLRGSAEEKIAAQVTKLKLLTVSRAQGEDDIALAVNGMIDELRDYPDWVIRDAVSRWLRKSKFFPTVVEFRAMCDGVVIRLTAIRKAIVA
jgi:hypothetical protein